MTFRADEPDPDAYERVVARASAASGVDFFAYKEATIHRRIDHRVAMTSSRSFAAYERLLDTDAGEVACLLDALLIKTTSMFREPASFDLLRHRLLPELCAAASKRHRSQLRAWVAGCSTGEEAFSMALCLLEATRDCPSIECHVVASDIDRAALERLARGVVSHRSLPSTTMVPSELAPWLEHDGAQVRIAASARDIISSAYHDLLDSAYPAPEAAVLASFDIVSCRNVLIYLQPAAQRSVIARLQRSCSDGAVLMLGQAEVSRQICDGLEPVVRGGAVFRVRRHG